ncbi:DUF342 domain-containing protein [Proteiniclasticum sp. BAD-10]|uniref:DUF342 domain-containing protein n=1 Tax=Proteiniclasticum sediminis TaxID=2804028 RepID=A0A941CQX0_9CLOT|nr:FapA family protein [Proteiniclasticum sediminis]MBR0575989.1 DUF342 domain-containing protein [Proteiniclasticum sediminis]
MILEASSRDEALARAMLHFGCKQDELHLVELEKPQGKLLGLWKKNGKYEIQRKAAAVKPISEDRDGAVAVVQGQIRVKGPVGRGSDPVLTFSHPQMSVLVNGKNASGMVRLKEEDEVTVTFEDLPAFTGVKVEYSDDLTQAYLKIQREKGRHFVLEDQPGQARLRLEPKEREVEPRLVKESECMELLGNHGVLLELVDRNAVKMACEALESIRVPVALGQAPVRSRKAQIDYAGELFVQSVQHGIEPVIKAGTVLAVKRASAVMGKPGMDVKGRAIPVERVVDEGLFAGDGAQLLENQVVALIDGRPCLKAGRISVIPLLTVVGDLDKDTANINFKGDVVVKGNVQDEMVIRSTGDITVLGSVYHSEIIADRNVLVEGKIIGGRTLAGNENQLYMSLLPHLESMQRDLEGLFQVIQSEGLADVPYLLQVLQETAEKVEANLAQLERALLSLSEEQKEELEQLKRKIRHAFFEIRLLRKEGFEELNETYILLSGLVRLRKDEILEPCMVKVKYAQNALISSSGHVVVTGKGSYLSRIQAGQEIHFTALDSVVKGGTLIAGKIIRVGYVGSPGEIPTLCQVLDPHGEIRGKFHKGTTLLYHDKIREYLPVE